jgi:hypothetical protein
LGFAGWLLVVWQLRDGNRQREAESLLHITGVNREIISLGFTHPELFQFLDGKKSEALQSKHYLQLWFNQFEMIHKFHERRAIPPELLEALERDIRDFMEQENARQHWKGVRQFYTPSFQAFLDGIANEKAGAPKSRPPRKRRFKR